MRALVTGSAGFVGRHMVRELLHRGWDVAQCDIAGDPPWDFDARKIFAGSAGFSGHQFDLVVHCAYHVGGRAAINGEPRNLALNVELDAAMFGWAVRTGQRAVLYLSSSAAYPAALQQGSRVLGQLPGSPLPGMSLPPHWLRESDVDLDDIRQPDSRYGLAKLVGEQLARAASEAGLRVHVVRPFSGYGAGQAACYPFPAIVGRVRSGDLTVWGPRGQVRDWIHISDIVSGALAVVEADYRLPVNLCSGDPMEFGCLALRVAYADGLLSPHGSEPDVTYAADQPTGVMWRVGDTTMMRHFWVPRVSLDDGIREALGE